ncbi:hypothetical protein BD414DRAFT_539340 [Trametes punicea]|nr:hypothetical protein BD414DRAFT_539340 [Trametes punicea]
MSDDPMSSGSDLTDIDDDDDDVALSARSKAKAKPKPAVDTGYRIRGALRVPRATTYTCQALYDQIYVGDIDLQPEYQRDVVWPDSKQVGLIDSIFRNFYVPPVIFVVHTLDDGGERRVCVDGKQRLTSIYRFIAGEIPYRDPFSGERFYFKDDPKGVKRQILPERYKKLFLNKQIVCMEYQDISPENEREIFQRVQLGMALTPAERLQAISSPLTSFIRQLLDTYIADGLAVDIEWDTSRANDFRTLATSVYSMAKWPKLSTAASIGTVEKWLHDTNELDKGFEDDVKNTFEIFCRLAKDPKLKKCFWLPGVKKVAPVEMLTISLLIHAFKRTMTLAQLSEAITLLRQEIRQVEKDIRLNSRTVKVALSFLKKLKPSQLKAEGGEPAAAQHHAVKRKRPAPTASEREGNPPRPSPKSQPNPSMFSKAAQPPHAISSPGHAPEPPQPLTQPPRPPAPPASPQTALSPAMHHPPSANPPGLPSGPNGIPTVPSNAQPTFAPPNTPAAPRQSMPPPSLPPRPNYTPTSPRPGDSRQNSLGDSLMARMSTAPPSAPSAPRRAGFPSPSTPFQPGPNDYQANRAYDPSRDPRHAAYQSDGRGGYDQHPSGSSYGRRF